MKWRRIFAVLLAAAPAAAPGLEKCVGTDGKVTYSDHGCAGSAKRSTIGLDTSLSNARIEYYDIAAPAASQAHASWTVDYTFATRPASSGCEVRSVTTKLDLTVRLPRWTPQPGTSQELQGRWERYLQALRVHEAGHLQTGKDFESNFKRAASVMKAADCGALGAAVRTQFNAMLEQARKRDRDYDAETRGGATQGAVF